MVVESVGKVQQLQGDARKKTRGMVQMTRTSWWDLAPTGIIPVSAMLPTLYAQSHRNMLPLYNDHLYWGDLEVPCELNKCICAPWVFTPNGTVVDLRLRYLYCGCLGCASMRAGGRACVRACVCVFVCMPMHAHAHFHMYVHGCVLWVKWELELLDNKSELV